MRNDSPRLGSFGPPNTVRVADTARQTARPAHGSAACGKCGCHFLAEDVVWVPDGSRKIFWQDSRSRGPAGWKMGDAADSRRRVVVPGGLKLCPGCRPEPGVLAGAVSMAPRLVKKK
jgi:hypothetical protein